MEWAVHRVRENPAHTPCIVYTAMPKNRRRRRPSADEWCARRGEDPCEVYRVRRRGTDATRPTLYSSESRVDALAIARSVN
jgi:hypothetical protein